MEYSVFSASMTEPRALHLTGKYSTTELHPNPALCMFICRIWQLYKDWVGTVPFGQLALARACP
jgi:hypothetical protein